MNPAPCRLGLLLVLLALACFALSTQARAACEDACLAGFNTVQGDNALLNLTTGFSNTAFGANALLSMTSASGNTAVGVDALYYDTTGYVNTAVGDTALFENTTGWANTAINNLRHITGTEGSRAPVLVSIEVEQLLVTPPLLLDRFMLRSGLITPARPRIWVRFREESTVTRAASTISGK